MLQCPVDACLFMLVVGGVVHVVLLVGIHVDDLVLVGVDSHLQWLRTALLREFKMVDIGRPTCVLGMDIEFALIMALFTCSSVPTSPSFSTGSTLRIVSLMIPPCTCHRRFVSLKMTAPSLVTLLLRFPTVS